jgi:hypothetical protein
VPDIPQIPTVAFGMGAIVRSPQLATIGDAVGGEAVLTRPQVQDLLGWAGMGTGAAVGAAGVNFYGPVSFGDDSSSAVAELDWWARYRMGAVA